MDYKNKKNGFILLLTLLTMTSVLMVALGIFDIILRENRIGVLSRDSQVALNAADGGLECAFYWDIKEGDISTTTTSSISCANQSFTVGGSSLFSFNVNFTNGSCASITIDKTNWPFTKVDSRGYNTGCTDNTPRKLERGMRAIY